MRRIGPTRRELVQALGCGGPATGRELAQRLQLSHGEVQYTLRNMQQAPRVEVVVLECVRVAGVSRPVPVYALPASTSDATAVLAQELAAVHFWGGIMSG